MSSLLDSVIDLSAFLLTEGTKVDVLGQKMDILRSLFFTGNVLDNIPAAAFYAPLNLLPVTDSSELIRALAEEESASEKPLKVALAAKDFRQYTTFSLDDEDDFI